MKSLHLVTKIEQDLQAAYDWYESQLADLGEQFLAEVDEVMASICEMPERFPVVFKDVRRAKLRRFPFGAYFTIQECRIIVLAVLHFSRSPRVWRRRIEE